METSQEKIRSLWIPLRGMNLLLPNMAVAEISSYRVVVIPEKMVVREAERAISYLGLFNYPVDSVVINRILTEMTDAGEFMLRRREVQAKYMEMIELWMMSC